MHTRQFGATDLQVSEVGFGAWGIGGPAMAGNIPIGWGKVNDAMSRKALQTAFEQGVNFYDTADFYGLGHSEELLGEAFGNSDKVIIASKVGHRLREDGSIFVDYSSDYIRTACEASLKRLRRECIDYYQLHTAKVADLEASDCVEALEALKSAGKIRYWGVSLSTYNPFPEADYLLAHRLGSGFQLVFNLINQRALPIIRRAQEEGLGVIARMPLQFGLLTGKLTVESRFPEDDHRHFRLTPPILEALLKALEPVWPLREQYGMSATELSLSFILSVAGVSTVIPGIKTPAQAIANTRGLMRLEEADVQSLLNLYEQSFAGLVDKMAKAEGA